MPTGQSGRMAATSYSFNSLKSHLNSHRKLARHAFVKQDFRACLEWMAKMPIDIETKPEIAFRHRVEASCNIALENFVVALGLAKLATDEDPCVQSCFVQFQAALRVDSTLEVDYVAVSLGLSVLS